MTYRRALKVALIPWLILSGIFIGWIVFDLQPSSEEAFDLSWRMGIALLVMYPGLAFTIFRINEILDTASSFRR